MAKKRNGGTRLSYNEVAILRPNNNNTATREDTIVLFQLLENYPYAHAMYSGYIIEANMGLVVLLARLPRFQNRGMTPSDLVEEGVVGLIRAVETFEWRRGFKFSTYATPWIKQAMQRACKMRGNEGRPVYIPNSADEITKIVTYERHKLKRRLGREPLNEEIAAELYEPRARRDTSELRRKRVMDARIRSNMRSFSLNDSLGEHDDETQAEKNAIADDHTQPLVERLAAHQLITTCMDFFSQNNRWLKLFIRRFGINQPRETLSEIAESWDLSRERVRQIEREMLMQLAEHRAITKPEIRDALWIVYPDS